MKRFPAPFLALMLAVMLTNALSAGPARKGAIWHTLPDGTSIQLRLIGDEFGHTYTTMDGRPVAIKEDGKVRLRTAIEIKELQESREALLEARRAQSLRGTSSSIRLTDATPAYRMKSFPAKGEIHGVVLLVEYADVSFSQD